MGFCPHLHSYEGSLPGLATHEGVLKLERKGFSQLSNSISNVCLLSFSTLSLNLSRFSAVWYC